MTATEQASAPTRTHLHTKWVVRMLLITVVLWAFGAWGFYDALIKYPATGKKASWASQLEYLEAAEAAGRLFDAPVVDPKGTLTELRAKDTLDRSELEQRRLEWLEVLETPGLRLLNAEHTRMDGDPQAELTRLREAKNTNPFPPTLNKYDIPVQWGICVICWGLGTYMLVLFVRVRSRVFRWDPATKTLTMPGGRQIAAADLDREDPVDLSKWSKYIVTLRPREGPPAKLDVLRYEPLEEWARTMAKSVNPDLEFPDETKAREAAEAAAAGDKAEEPAAGEGSTDAEKPDEPERTEG